MHFHLCRNCREEVAVKNGVKYDYEYKKSVQVEHTCDGVKQYPENGTNLMRQDAKG